MKKQQLKLSLNKMKIASVRNTNRIRGGNGTTVNGQCEDDVLTFLDASCNLCPVETNRNCETVTGGGEDNSDTDTTDC